MPKLKGMPLIECLLGNVSGASMMVSRKVLDEVGIFDPDFFMYSE